MVTFICPRCGQERTGKRRRCYYCTATILTAEEKDRIRQKLTGVRHSDERRRANSDGQKKRTNRFDLASVTRGKPSPRAHPLGATYTNRDGRVFVKVATTGKYWYQMWKRRAHVVWEATNGPIPPRRLLHHMNHDCSDDALDNLQLVTRAEHARIHGTPERQRAAQLLGVVARKRAGSYRRKQH